MATIMTNIPPTNDQLPPPILPVIVIVGPTASGKTDLAVRIAKQVGGEIICADSRTVYAGMDVGTAKPSIDERSGIPHHGLDLLSPGQRFTAADFQQYANTKIDEIHERGAVAIMVGGTGLYIDSVIFDYQFGPDRNEKERAKLAEMTIEQLRTYCDDNNIELPQNDKNKRHVIRAIEQKGINLRSNSSIKNNYFIVGITVNRSVLQKRIEARARAMFKNGVVKEATKLGKRYGWDSAAMTGSIYRILRHTIGGSISEEEARDLFVRSDMRLAKRQMTWFRRNPFIQWSQDAVELEKKCISFVQEFRS